MTNPLAGVGACSNARANKVCYLITLFFFTEESYIRITLLYSPFAVQCIETAESWLKRTNFNISKQAFAEIDINAPNFHSKQKDEEFIISGKKVRQNKKERPKKRFCWYTEEHTSAYQQKK